MITVILVSVPWFFITLYWYIRFRSEQTRTEFFISQANYFQRQLKVLIGDKT